MSRRYVLTALAAATLFVCGWAVAQPGPGPKAGPEASGRYAVTATADRAILVDTATGQTWLLRPGVDVPHGLPPAWEPIHRLEPSAVEEWKVRERRRKQEIARPKTEKK